VPEGFGAGRTVRCFTGGGSSCAELAPTATARTSVSSSNIRFRNTSKIIPSFMRNLLRRNPYLQPAIENPETLQLCEAGIFQAGSPDYSTVLYEVLAAVEVAFLRA
jgi:hypothetical protein